jgi:membrane fusion protein, heavy metal efflux system
MRYCLIQFIIFISVLGILTGCNGAPSAQHEPEATDHDSHGSGSEHNEERGHGEGHEDQTSSIIHMEEETQRALNIKTVAAEVKPFEKTLDVTGQVAQDSDRFHHIYSDRKGLLNTLLVSAGERVEKGAVVAKIDLNDAKGISEVLAPISGLVMGTHVVPGASTDTLTSLMTIADLSQVWATFDFYEQDVGLVKVGQRIDVYSVAYPERAFSGKVIFVSPQVDSHTRTIKVRAQVENPDYALKLGMFVRGLLYVPILEKALIIPSSAIQYIKDERFVFIRRGPDEFEAHEVEVGQETPRYVEILSDLQEGDQVVSSGSFHFKAELLKGTLEKGHAH